MSLLDVKNLTVNIGDATPVNSVSFTIEKGETFVLLGESGCGKSMTALALMRLLPNVARITAGSVELGGKSLLALPETKMRGVRGGSMGMIFQEPGTSLNPVMTLGQQIGEVLAMHRGLRGDAARKETVALLDCVGLPDAARRMDEYPFQFSGGMKQRAMIAMALAGEPELLIADEPTTALDVTLQAQVLALLKKLQRERGMGILLITHDLGVAEFMADHIGVMYAGQLVEVAPREQLFASPSHAYTQKLFAAQPGGRERRPVAQEAGQGDLLSVRDLKVHFPIRHGLLQRTVGHVKAVDGVSLSLREGETLALVGESGSGKTTVGKAILQLLPVTEGSISVAGAEAGAGKDATALRAQAQMVFQDPFASLNPRMRIGEILREGMLALKVPGNHAARIKELLEQVGLRPEMVDRYPHEFSGGQRQRIAIARALAVNPKLLICDEPTSALDVSVQVQIVNLLHDLQKQLGIAYLFITHNITLVDYLADYVAVMYRGRIVEMGKTEDVLDNPQHPYTRTLLDAVLTRKKAG